MSSDDEHDSRLSHSSSDAETSSTADGIADARLAKSTKTRKRKRRATSPSRFGSALTALLESDLPSNHQPLALKPAAAKRRTDEALESKARKLLEGERKEREEKNHIQDVIGGWGTERERSLRKVAQRGVVKLFNAIQETQAAAAAAQEEAKASRGSGKPTLPKPQLDLKSKKKKAGPTGTEKSLNQDTFLRIIKAGGIVSAS